MNKTITVFTPTYNRAHLLHRLYESLLRQTNQDFTWLVIDDGSVDNTREIVNRFISEGRIEITYLYKENGGLHTGYNTAIEYMDTELSICIDSDDWLPDDAIDIILKVWGEIDDDAIAGIIGLDYTPEGHIIGEHLNDGELINPLDLLVSRKNYGDKKYIVRNDLYRTVSPMPVFEGEKNFNPHYMILKLSAQYRFRAVDVPLCIVDYQSDGMTANQFRQYLNSPNSFAEYRRAILNLPRVPYLYKLRTIVHYCSSSQICHNKNYIRETSFPILTALCTPLGWLLTYYIKKKINE